MSDLPLFEFDFSRTPCGAGCRPAVAPPQVPGSRPAGDLPAEVQGIIGLLRDRHGRASGITAPAIANQLDILPGRPAAARGTYVRDLISTHLFSFPFAVVGDTHVGYYRPALGDELDAALQSLDDRHVQIGRRRKAIVQTARAEGWYQDDHGRWVPPTASR